MNQMTFSDMEYSGRKRVTQKEKFLREKICSGDFTPKEALLLVKDNWDLLYTYQSTYEAC